ncbi:transposase [Micromonospora sp. ATA32]|nr:transposase [Micromonospora sp. ATA32]
MQAEYDGRQIVGIDLHRRRSVIVRMTEAGEKLETVRIDNDPVALGLEIVKAGPDPEVVLEAIYGWYWAVDVLRAAGARVHLAHPLGVKGFTYRRVKNDARDAADLRICCAWAGCRRPMSPRRQCGSCGNWCGIEPSWSRGVRG